MFLPTRILAQSWIRSWSDTRRSCSSPVAPGTMSSWTRARRPSRVSNERAERGESPPVCAQSVSTALSGTVSSGEKTASSVNRSTSSAGSVVMLTLIVFSTLPCGWSRNWRSASFRASRMSVHRSPSWTIPPQIASARGSRPHLAITSSATAGSWGSSTPAHSASRCFASAVVRSCTWYCIPPNAVSRPASRVVTTIRHFGPSMSNAFACSPSQRSSRMRRIARSASRPLRTVRPCSRVSKWPGSPRAIARVRWSCTSDGACPTSTQITPSGNARRTS